MNADFPVADERLPRFIDDAASAKLLIAARAHPDSFTRLTVEFLARTGLRKGEYLALTTDAVVKIGSAVWLRVPIGKLHNDRYIPLHPQLKELLDGWIARRPQDLRSDCSSSSAAGPFQSRGSIRRSARPPPRASATSRRTSSATPWPPRPSTAA